MSSVFSCNFHKCNVLLTIGGYIISGKAVAARIIIIRIGVANENYVKNE